MMSELIFRVIACAFNLVTGETDHEECVAHLSVVSHRGECHELLAEIKRRLPENVRLSSYPECFSATREKMTQRRK